MDITGDRRFKRFIKNRTIRSGTLERYRIEITQYSEFLNKTPDEFITEAENEEDQGLRLSQRTINDYLLDYKDYLVENNYSPRTIIVRLSSIKSFYKQFDVVVPRINYSKKNIKKESLTDLPTKDEIREALTFANVKYEAIIKTALSTGLRSSDIRALSYHDFIKSLHQYIKVTDNTMISVDELIQILSKTNEEIIPTWKITTIKNDTPVTTFSTPECVDAILKYLKTQPPKTLETPLFPSGRFKTKPISKRAFFNYFVFLNNKCDFGMVGSHIKLHSHSFRKIFATTLMNQGLQQITISRLLGHTIDEIQEAYIKQDDNFLKEQYTLCIAELSLRDTQVHHVTTEDKQRLIDVENDNKKLRSEMEVMLEAIKTGNLELLLKLPPKE